MKNNNFKYKTTSELSEILSEDTCFAKISVYDENLSEMARIGKFAKSQLEIHIEGSEGFIPHIHICKGSGKNIICRIKLLVNEYFRESNDPNNTLSRQEKVALNKYMQSTLPFSEITMWQHIMNQWNVMNPTRAVDFSKTKQPDFSTINEPN